MSNTTGDNVRMPYPDDDDSPLCMIYDRRYVNGLIDIINSRQEQVEKLHTELAEREADLNTARIIQKATWNDLQKANERIAMMENQRKFDNDMLKGKDERIAELQTRVKCAERLIDFELMAQYESDCADAINKPESGV